MYSPVVIFTFNRPSHLRRTLQALAANTLAVQTPLVAYSDAARNTKDAPLVDEVRDILKNTTGFASVTVNNRERNIGLADSIVDGVSDVIRRYGRAVVLEDDIIVSPYFLDYMNTALARYEHEERVMHIAAHMLRIPVMRLPESFFLRQSSCWGWATWERAWQHFHRQGEKFIRSFTPDDIIRFNLDGAYDYWGQLLANENGLLKTWAVYWYACVFSQGGLCLHPRQSLAQNIGFDGSGENCAVGESDVPVFRTKSPSFYPDFFEEHGPAMRRYKRELRRAGPKTRWGVVQNFFTGMFDA